MKVLLLFFAVVVVAALLYADYKWRQWMKARKRERSKEIDRPVN